MDPNEKDALRFCAALALVAVLALGSLAGVVTLANHYAILK